MTIKTGDRVVIDNDSHDKNNKVARVIDVQGHKCIVESEDGVTMTLSLNQVRPQTFLAE